MRLGRCRRPGVVLVAALTAVPLALLGGCGVVSSGCSDRTAGVVRWYLEAVATPPGTQLREPGWAGCDDSAGDEALGLAYYEVPAGRAATDRALTGIDAQLLARGWHLQQGRSNDPSRNAVFTRSEPKRLWAQVGVYRSGVVSLALNDGPRPY